jgi:hypothetical protein
MIKTLENRRAHLVLAAVLSFSTSLPVASTWADTIISEKLIKREVLTCKRPGESPCTVNSPCHGVFTYCATTLQCKTAKEFAENERQCLLSSPRDYCCPKEIIDVSPLAN